MNIPKIIHQIWIGNKPPPINLMNTWKEKNPDYEYILWNENEFIKRKSKHRIRNIGKKTAVMIEIQFGDKIDEKDIKSYDDKYGRS